MMRFLTCSLLLGSALGDFDWKEQDKRRYDNGNSIYDNQDSRDRDRDDRYKDDYDHDYDYEDKSWKKHTDEKHFPVAPVPVKAKTVPSSHDITPLTGSNQSRHGGWCGPDICFSSEGAHCFEQHDANFCVQAMLMCMRSIVKGCKVGKDGQVGETVALSENEGLPGSVTTLLGGLGLFGVAWMMSIELRGVSFIGALETPLLV